MRAFRIAGIDRHEEAEPALRHRADSRFGPLSQTPIGQAHPRMRCLLTNLEKQTWPITGATFVLIYKQQQKHLTATQMLNSLTGHIAPAPNWQMNCSTCPCPKTLFN